MNTIDIDAEEVKYEKANENDEDTKLYDKITKMTDEELIDAIESPVEIKEVDNKAFTTDNTSELDDEEFNPNKFFLKTMEAEDLITLYDLAIKAKNDPKFNVVSNLPKSIYDLMVKTIYKDKSMLTIPKKDLSKFIRLLVINLGKEIEMDEEFKSIKKDLSDILKEGQLEFIDAYAEYTKESFDTKLRERAYNEKDPVLKKKLMDLSKAYKDSYALKLQKDLLDDEVFMNRLIKNETKRFDRLCDDFDFTLNKKFMHKISIRDLFKLLPKIIKVNDLQIKDYIIATCIATRSVATNDAPGLMYMYNSINIIKILFQASDILDDDRAKFVKECMGNVKEFFTKLQIAKDNQNKKFIV